MTVYYTATSRAVDVGEELDRGGEGSIHVVRSDALMVAKLYHSHRITTELESKLAAMVANRPIDPTWESQRHRSIAWVEDVLYSDASAKQFRGYLMPFIDSKVFLEAHSYFDPADRTNRFGGDFTWRHLLTASQNLASCIAAIHAEGHRIGDLRETNVLIAPNALVCLVDCDSFQIRDRRRGRTFPTRVGTGEYLPPELIGVDFGSEDVDRYASDLFALGVILFKFLMQGVHPFQARGNAIADAPSTEAKIALGHFPYERGEIVEPPQFAPPYDVIPKPLRQLFRACFVAGHGNPESRPAATAWFRALQEVAGKLRKCSKNENHWYAGRRSCPWCAMLASGSPDPFPRPLNLGHQIPATSSETPLASGEERRKFLVSFIEMAVADGSLAPEEQRYIEELGLQLGLSQRDIRKLIGAARPAAPAGRTPAPAPPAAPPPAPPAPSAPIPRPRRVGPLGRWLQRRRSTRQGIPKLLDWAVALSALSGWPAYKVGKWLASGIAPDRTGAIIAPPLPNCGLPFGAAVLSQWAFATAALLATALACGLVFNGVLRARSRIDRGALLLIGVLFAGSFAVSRWVMPVAITGSHHLSASGYDIHLAETPAACAYAGTRVAWTRENFGTTWAYRGTTETIVSHRHAPSESPSDPRLVTGFRVFDGAVRWQHVVRRPFSLELDVERTRTARHRWVVVNVLDESDTRVSAARLDFRTGRPVRGSTLPRRYWRS